MTDDLHEEARKVEFGDWVTITFQAVDDDDDPVAEEDVEVRMLIVERSDGRTRDRTSTYETDSSGRFQLRFRHTDPDSRGGDRATVDLTIRNTDLRIKDETARSVASGGVLEWSDEEEEATVLLLEQVGGLPLPHRHRPRAPAFGEGHAAGPVRRPDPGGEGQLRVQRSGRLGLVPGRRERRRRDQGEERATASPPTGAASHRSTTTASPASRRSRPSRPSSRT